MVQENRTLAKREIEKAIIMKADTQCILCANCYSKQYTYIHLILIIIPKSRYVYYYFLSIYEKENLGLGGQAVSQGPAAGEEWPWDLTQAF